MNLPVEWDDTGLRTLWQQFPNDIWMSFKMRDQKESRNWHCSCLRIIVGNQWHVGNPNFETFCFASTRYGAPSQGRLPFLELLLWQHCDLGLRCSQSCWRTTWIVCGTVRKWNKYPSSGIFVIKTGNRLEKKADKDGKTTTLGSNIPGKIQKKICGFFIAIFDWGRWKMPFLFPQLGPLAINRYPVPQTFATPSESPGDDERITRLTSKKKHSNRFLMVKTLESTCLMLKHFWC